MSVGGVVQHVRSRCPCSGVWPLSRGDRISSQVSSICAPRQNCQGPIRCMQCTDVVVCPTQPSVRRFTPTRTFFYITPRSAEIMDIVSEKKNLQYFVHNLNNDVNTFHHSLSIQSCFRRPSVDDAVSAISMTFIGGFSPNSSSVNSASWDKDELILGFMVKRSKVKHTVYHFWGLFPRHHLHQCINGFSLVQLGFGVKRSQVRCQHDQTC